MRTLSLLVLVVLGGCQHTRALNRARLNARAVRQPAALVLTDGRCVDAQSLHVAPDVTTWVDPETGTAQSVPTAELASVTLVDRRRGTLEGVGIGLAGGVVLGISVGTFWEFGKRGFDGDPDRAGTIGAAVGGGLGAGLGALIGRSRGSRWVYVRSEATRPGATVPARR